jgi:hypothetical protein
MQTLGTFEVRIVVGKVVILCFIFPGRQTAIGLTVDDFDCLSASAVATRASMQSGCSDDVGPRIGIVSETERDE